jgi:hypothetical protein
MSPKPNEAQAMQKNEAGGGGGRQKAFAWAHTDEAKELYERSAALRKSALDEAMDRPPAGLRCAPRTPKATASASGSVIELKNIAFLESSLDEAMGLPPRRLRVVERGTKASLARDAGAATSDKTDLRHFADLIDATAPRKGEKVLLTKWVAAFASEENTTGNKLELGYNPPAAIPHPAPELPAPPVEWQNENTVLDVNDERARLAQFIAFDATAEQVAKLARVLAAEKEQSAEKVYTSAAGYEFKIKKLPVKELTEEEHLKRKELERKRKQRFRARKANKKAAGTNEPTPPKTSATQPKPLQTPSP